MVTKSNQNAQEKVTLEVTKNEARSLEGRRWLEEPKRAKRARWLQGILLFAGMFLALLGAFTKNSVSAVLGMLFICGWIGIFAIVQAMANAVGKKKYP